MKKLIAMIAVVAAVAANAASVSWQLTSTAAENNYLVYVFAEPIEGQYESFADFAADSIGDGKIIETAGRKGSTYATAALTANGVTDKLYIAILSDTNAKTYSYAEFDASAFI